MKTITARLLALTLTALLVACGGGSSPDPEVCQPGVSTMRFPLGCATDTGVTLGVPTLKLVLFDTTGATISQVSPAQSGVLQALVRDKAGAVAPNIAVTFSTTDQSGTFVPSSGTALTDANGVAKVGLPAGTQIGAFTLTASATVGGFPTAAKIDYAVALPTLTMSVALFDATGAAITQVSPDQSGVLKALVKDKAGAVAPNVAVTFATSDKTGAFVPKSGTALTDANGVAKVGVLAGTQAGAFTLSAGATFGDVAATAKADYAVAFPTLTLSALGIAPATVSAGGTTSLTVTVMNGSNPFLPAQSVSFSSPCALAGKATIGSPVVTVNGVANTSYIDKGCGAADLITASTSLGDTTVTRAGTVTVLAATAGQIAFVSALPQNIAMKGTGGAGRQESSTVVFKVLDKNSNPVSGVKLDFSLTSTVGGLTLNPAFATTDANGNASTVVAAGIVNTPVRVLATAMGGSISTLSDQLVISTGIPDQNSFTVAPTIYNNECGDYDVVIPNAVTALVADHFNNPVPDGTAVSFTTEGGAIDASCLTGVPPPPTTLTDGSKIVQQGVPGQCSVRFICQNPRPADGRSTVLVYAQGEESFADDPTIKDGINRYDLGEPFQDLREPFRFDRAITNFDAKAVNLAIPILTDPYFAYYAIAPVLGEPYIDSDGSGFWNSSGDSFYNGVLQTAPNGKTPTIHVRDSFVLVFSGSHALITPLNPVPVQLDHCTNGTPFVNGAKTLALAIRDSNSTVFSGNSLSGNILPAGTSISFTTSNGKLLSEGSFTVPNTNDPSSAAWTYYVTLQSDATQSGLDTTPPYICTNPVTGGLLTVKVTTPRGVITTQSFSVND